MDNTLHQLFSLSKQAKTSSISQYFSEEPHRFKSFSFSGAGVHADFSKQNISRNILNSLLEWSEHKNLQSKIAAMFSGAAINNTENRSVLHSVLRANVNQKEQVLGKKIS